MKLNVKSLIQVLDINTKCLTGSKVIPNYDNLLFEFNEKGCNITSGNGVIQVKTFIKPIEIVEGSLPDFQIEGKTFIDTVKLIDEEEITFEVKENIATIKAGRKKYKLAIASPIEYPRMKSDIKEFTTVPNSIVANIINASKLVDNNNLRESVSGVNIFSKDDKLHIMGSNGSLYFFSKIPSQGEDFADIQINREVASIIDVFQNSNDIQLKKDSKSIILIADSIEVIVRLVDAAFPSSLIVKNCLVDKARKGNNFPISKNDLSKSIRRASLYADFNNKTIVFNFKDNEVSIESENVAHNKSSNEVIETPEGSVNDMEVKFNFTFLQRTLSAVDFENMLVNVESSNSPMNFIDKDPSNELIIGCYPVFKQ